MSAAIDRRARAAGLARCREVVPRAGGLALAGLAAAACADRPARVAPSVPVAVVNEPSTASLDALAGPYGTLEDVPSVREALDVVAPRRVDGKPSASALSAGGVGVFVLAAAQAGGAEARLLQLSSVPSGGDCVIVLRTDNGWYASQAFTCYVFTSDTRMSVEAPVVSPRATGFDVRLRREVIDVGSGHRSVSAFALHCLHYPAPACSALPFDPEP